MAGKKKQSDYLPLFRAAGLPQPVSEYRFPNAAGRKWRVDYAWPHSFLAVEIEGGVWTMGRHNHPSGFVADMEKYNHLALAGFWLLRFQPKELKAKDAKAIRMIRQFLESERPERQPVQMTIEIDW